MANNIKLFNTVAEYEAAELVYPSVSYIVETDRVAYDELAPTPSFKWKATYSDGHTESKEPDGSNTITKNEINKTNLVSVELGDSVTRIGEQAFEGCKHLTTINLSGVTSIGNWAFRDCSALSGDISLDSIVSIGDGVFGYSSGLTSVTIGSGCTSIGTAAFNYHTQNYIPYLACLPTTPPSLNNLSFGDTLALTKLPTVYVPAESVDAYKAVLNNGTFPTASVKPIQ